MFTRFDHLVIGVRNLEQAMECYRSFGFVVQPGGRHTGQGTHNALIRFGLEYIELLSIEEPVKASSLRGDVLSSFLQQHTGGLLGYALATNTIHADAERLYKEGLDVVGPIAMQRRRPDGHLLSWYLLIPDGISWRRPWPFFIQWDDSDEQRLKLEQPGQHPNGVTGWGRIAVGVKDLVAAIDLYQRQLGLTLVQQSERPLLGARSALFQLGSSVIDLLEPTGPGIVHDTLEAYGEGPIEITLTTEDLNRTRAALAQAGVTVLPGIEDTQTIVLAAPVTSGTRIVFAQR
jgi:catechol 2,3-dioxygenase-like lactoylglutathione lyase family enzyme